MYIVVCNGVGQDTTLTKGLYAKPDYAELDLHKVCFFDIFESKGKRK